MPLSRQLTADVHWSLWLALLNSKLFIPTRVAEGRREPATDLVVLITMIDGLTRWTRRRDHIFAAVLGNTIILRASTGRVLTFAVVSGHDATFTVNDTHFHDGQLIFYLVVRPSMAIAAAWNVMIFIFFLLLGRLCAGIVRIWLDEQFPRNLASYIFHYT